MNSLFFLIPKSQVAYVEEGYTLRQVAEKLQYHGYSAIPILTNDGKYIATISDGDLFWYIKERQGMNYETSENIRISEVPLKRRVDAIRFDADMKELFKLVIQQNFVPVLDDLGVFMGIVTRKSIIEYYMKKIKD